MDHRADAGRMRARLLASVGLALAFGLAAPAGAGEPEERVALLLTEGPDDVTVAALGLLFDRRPDAHGLAPPIAAFGVRALGGDDQVTLLGVSTLLGRVRETRDYAAPPEAEDLLLQFAAGPHTRALATGIDGGAGADRLTQRGSLRVEADAGLSQASFVELYPWVQVAIDSRVDAAATGLAGGEGADTATLDGALRVDARAAGERIDLNVDFLALGGLPQSMLVGARAIGLAGDGGSDLLHLAAGSDATVGADAAAEATRVSYESLRLAAPANATVAEARATGADGGPGGDHVVAGGRLAVAARARTLERDASLIIKDLTLPGELGFQPENREGNRAVARVLGLAGGGGDDELDHRGMLLLVATASREQLSLTIGDGGIASAAIEVLDRSGPSPEEPSSGAIATLVGLAGGGPDAGPGGDTLSNSGSIVGRSTATARSDTLFVAFPLSETLGNPWGPLATPFDSFGVGLIAASTNAFAGSRGLEGGAGADTLANAGTIGLLSEARSSLIGASLVGLDAISPGDGGTSELFSLNLTVFNLANHAVARSAAIAAGGGDDLIRNGGALAIRADAGADTAALNLSVGQEQRSLLVDASAIFSRTWADAAATGIDGGGGRNRIVHGGGMTVEADARARQLTASLSAQLVDTGMAGSLAYLDSDVLAHAAATGLADPAAWRGLDSPGAIAARARAVTESVSASVGLGLERGPGVGLAGAIVQADQQSRATARGIAIGGEGVNRGAGPLRVGPVLAEAEAGADRLKLDVAAASATKGVALAATLSSSRTEALADSAAVTLASPAVEIRVDGDLAARADATARNAEGAVGLAVAEKGVALGVTAARIDTRSDGRAMALSLGDMAGPVLVAGALHAEARGAADSAAVLADLAGGQQGVALGATLLDGRTRAHAEAAALAGGSGRDRIETLAPVSALADAGARALDAGLSIATESKGVAAGVALARTETDAEARARAIGLGGGDDWLLTQGDLAAEALATVQSISATVGLGMTGTGAGVGAAAVDSGVRGRATAIAVDAGDGADRLLALAPVSARAGATAETLGLSVGLGLSPKGVSVGLAGLRGDTGVRASAAGLAGGAGADMIETDAPVTVAAEARARRTDVALASAAAGKGAALTGTMLLAETLADARAVGLAGDGDDGEAEGDGDDQLVARGGIRVAAHADARTDNVSISGPLAVGFTASLLKGEVDARATARGLAGGGGNDLLWNRDVLTVEALAEARGFALTLATVGATLDRTDTAALAQATGLSGGSGHDLLLIHAAVDVASRAEARSLGISIVATGFSLGRQTTEAEARGTGVSGGSGDDGVELNAPVAVTVAATAPHKRITIGNLAGILGDSRVRAEASATGVDAGPGDDWLAGIGRIDVGAAADVRSLSVTLAKTGLVNAEVGSRALAAATGVDMGDGRDVIDLAGPVRASSQTQLSGINIAAEVTGGGRADTSSRSEALATGLGAGIGRLEGRIGDIVANSWARAEDVTVAVALSGYSEVDAATRARAHAAGIATAGALDLESSGPLLASAIATADSRGGNLGILNVSVADLAAHGRASAAGLSSLAGAGDVAWRLTAPETATVSARGEAKARTIPVSAIGLGFIDTGARAFADARLLDGRGGADHRLDLFAPAGEVRATATGRLESIVANIGGLASLDHRGGAVATAIGADTGGGSDRIEIRGPGLAVVADALVESEAQRLAFGSLAFGRLALEAEAEAALARTGGGDDAVILRAPAGVGATATADSRSLDVQGLGILLGSRGVGASASAAATGVDGGDGGDNLLAFAPLSVTAEARTRDAPLSIQLAGVDLADAGARTDARAIGMTGGSGDDFVSNAHILGVRANALGLSRNTSIQVAGAQLGASEVANRALAIGLDGGSGSDEIRQSGLLDVGATAIGSAVNLSVTGAGAAIRGGARTLTQATALGVTGGEGDDSLIVSNLTLVRALAAGGASSTAIAALGAASADLSATAEAGSTGVAGGDGDDLLLVNGRLEVSAASAIGLRTLTSTGAGVTLRGRGESLALAEAVGLDAGEGANIVRLDNAATVSADAGSQGSALNVTVGGVGRAELRTAAEATARGIRAGAGDDRADVRAPLSTFASAFLDARGRSVTLFGTGSARADTRASAFGTGIDLGDGRNLLHITAAAPLRFESLAFLDGSAAAFTLAGTAATGGIAGATADQTGVRTGDGDDRLEVAAPVEVRAGAEVQANGSSMAILGTAASGGDFGAAARATGIALGAGADELVMTRSLLAHATAATRSDVSSYAFAGVAGGNSALATEALATGVRSGFGTIRVAVDMLDIRASSETRLTGSHRVEFGSTAGGRSALLGGAGATGLALAGEQARVELLGPGEVTARADVSFSFSEFVLAGVADGRNAATARAAATGVAAGLRPELVLVARPLGVAALPTVVGSGTARATVGGKASAGAETVAEGRATGIEADRGVSLLLVPGTGGIDVRVDPLASGRTEATAGALFSDGRTRAQARVDALATAIALPGSFSKTVEIAAPVEARVMGYRDGVETGIARAFAESRGTAGIANSTEALARSEFTQRAVALEMGSGAATVRITGGGNLRAEARGHLYTEARALGSQSLFTGDSWARADGVNENATAIGLASAGLLDLENRGSILAEASPSATMRTDGRNSGIRNIGASARANAVSFLDLDGARAIGVEATGLSATITNHGIISARARPEATAFAQASRLEGIEPVNAAATSSSYVNGTRAWGIRADPAFGTKVLNLNLIRADANPFALADSDPNAAGPSANATARATAEAINTRAFGVETGGGNDRIENRGTIFVQSLPLAVAATRASAGPGGSRNNFPEFRAEVFVGGIVSGAGDDVIINRGRILTDIDGPAFRAANNIALLGRVAIDAGPGNDQVYLIGGETRGDILLGPGDDLLQIQDSPLIADGVLRGGSGRDMLRLFGGSTQTLDVAEFADLEKFSTGTWRLTGFPGSQTIRVVAGTVEFAGTVPMSGAHATTSRIWPSGEVGRIHFDSAGLQLLAGRLTVETVPGVHVNGRTWDVLTARGGLGNVLSGIDLPPATGLVSFAGAFEAPGPLGAPTRYRVRVTVLPMAGVARGLGAPAESFAAALDGATPAASGAVAHQIAALQQLGTAGEARAAVQALAPQLPQLALRSASGAIAANLALLKARPGSAAFVSPAGLPLTGSRHGTAPGAGGSAWGHALAGPGAGSATLRRGTSLASGWQLASPDGLVLGLATLRLDADHGVSGAATSGRAETMMVAAHADLPLGDRLQAGLVIGGGRSAFAGAQSRPTAGEGEPARLRQDSGLVAAGLVTRWQPFPARPGLLVEAGLDWTKVEGEKAREAAGSGLALRIDRARLDQLESEVAVRWHSQWPIGRLPLATDLRLGWQHSLRPGAALVGAAFADMPEHRFRLLGPAPARDRLRLDLVGRLGGDSGWSLEMAGLLSTGELDAAGRQGTELGAALRLGFRF